MEEALDQTALATVIAAFIAAGVGLANLRLSKRVQDTAMRRQAQIDAGSFVEERHVFEKDLRDYLASELRSRDEEHEREKAELRRQARVVIGYWRDRALGKIDPDTTPPPEVYGI